MTWVRYPTGRVRHALPDGRTYALCGVGRSRRGVLEQVRPVDMLPVCGNCRWILSCYQRRGDARFAAHLALEQRRVRDDLANAVCERLLQVLDVDLDDAARRRRISIAVADLLDGWERANSAAAIAAIRAEAIGAAA